VLATWCIEALVRRDEAGYGLSTDDVGVNDLVHVLCADMAVPDCVRIDHDVGTVLALVKTPSFVRTNLVL
jgi:hypothetical protein